MARLNRIEFPRVGGKLLMDNSSQQSEDEPIETWEFSLVLKISYLNKRHQELSSQVIVRCLPTFDYAENDLFDSGILNAISAKQIFEEIISRYEKKGFKLIDVQTPPPIPFHRGYTTLEMRIYKYLVYTEQITFKE
jgi:hypothetical protein